MTFRFSNNALVSLSSVEAKDLRAAAWDGRHQNAVTVLDGAETIVVTNVPLATGDELIAAAYRVRPTSNILRLRRELKLEYHQRFAYRGLVRGPGSAEEEFAYDSDQPLAVGDTIAIDTRDATVISLDPSEPQGFDGIVRCEWAVAESAG